MRLKETESALVQTNAPALKTYNFRVGNASTVMMLLSKLYSNPIQTLTQEYLCNGRDAARAAKRGDKPLLVLLPTESKPTLKIRDYGIGVSEENVRDVLVAYGESTKRESDEQTGGFGIGLKAGLVYTDNFTIITYMGGQARHYVCHVGENKIPQLDLNHEGPTIEADGTEIQIAVKKEDIESFCNAVERATCLWDVKPEFISDAIYYSEPLLSMDGVKFCKETPGFRNNAVYLAVDGIPYEVDSRFDALKEVEAFKNRLSWSRDFHHVVIHCGNKDVDVTPSRETLQDTPDTVAGIKKFLNKAQKEMTKHATELLATETKLGDFLILHKGIRDFFKLTQSHTFKDKSDKTSYEVDAKGCILSGLPSGLQCLKVTKRRRKKETLENVPTDSESLLYAYYCDDKISNRGILVRLNEKVKELGRYDTEEFIVLSHLDLQDAGYLAFVNKLDATAIYSIQTKKAPPTPKEREGLKTMGDRQTQVNVFTGEGNKTVSKIVDFDVNPDTYVYVVKESGTDRRLLEKYSALNSICEKIGVKLCFVASSRTKKILGNEKFVSVDDFFRDLNKYADKKTFTEMQADAKRFLSKSIRDDMGYLLNEKAFVKVLPQLRDKETRNLLTELAGIVDGTESYRYGSPKYALVDEKSGIVDAIVKLAPDIKRFKKDAESTSKRIEKNYAMLLRVEIYKTNVSKFVPEILWYFNAKFKEGLKD